MRHVTGSCHCSNIRFDFYLPSEEPIIPIRACGCTFCQKHRGEWTSHPEGRLVAKLAEPEEVNRYQFGHGTADFYICKRCGVAPFVVSTVNGSDRAVVNAHSFDNVPSEELVSSSTDFDGESVDGRLARRDRNWIGDVTVE